MSCFIVNCWSARGECEYCGIYGSCYSTTNYPGKDIFFVCLSCEVKLTEDIANKLRLMGTPRKVCVIKFKI
jgi:hypothetical protein